ncbi:M126 protein, partial [Calyptomena viridis]|nr:M126 protein [Calyptomena viridis]
INGDKELTFEEFVIILCKVTDDAHRISHNSDRCRALVPWLYVVTPNFHTSGGSWCYLVQSFLFQTSQSQGPLSELEKSMNVLIDVFHQYSRREGDRDTLTKKELKLLIEKQLVNYLQHVKNKATIDEIMKDLDINKDAQLSFCEVMLLITRVTIATHEHLHEVEDQQHKHQHQHQHQHQH